MAKVASVLRKLTVENWDMYLTSIKGHAVTHWNFQNAQGHMAGAPT